MHTYISKENSAGQVGAEIGKNHYETQTLVLSGQADKSAVWDIN